MAGLSCGIVGLPNVGKSTFISRVSKAKSKIADYPFTTKRPILGLVKYFDKTLTFADMPGLIEGAHKGKGLGDRFLRHIERTGILLHMVDINSEKPYNDLLKIQEELRLFDEGLLRKKRIIANQKIDQK